jgi:DNA primase
MITEKVKLTSDFLGSYRKQGSEYLFTCPYCDHHKKKFSLNYDLNVYKCWVCDVKGRNIRRLVRRYGNFSSLKEWDKITGIVDFSRESFELFPDPIDEKPHRIDLPGEFRTLTGKIKISDKRALCYLQNRGLHKGDILRYKIGYCSEGEYEGRIIIPSFDIDGYVNFFIARSFGNHWLRYKNPNVSRNIIFNELNIDWDSDVVLVEGVFDAIFAGNAVALLGSTLREESRLFQHIIKNDTSVFIALDPDAEKKAMRIVRTLMKYDVEVWKIDIPEGKDVAELGSAAFEKLKQGAILLKDNNDYLLQRKVMSI